jgi:aspartate racemase
MHSVNFEEIEKLQHAGDWETLTKVMIKNAKNLEK